MARAVLTSTRRRPPEAWVSDDEIPEDQADELAECLIPLPQPCPRPHPELLLLRPLARSPWHQEAALSGSYRGRPDQRADRSRPGQLSLPGDSRSRPGQPSQLGDN